MRYITDSILILIFIIFIISLSILISFSRPTTSYNESLKTHNKIFLENTVQIENIYSAKDLQLYCDNELYNNLNKDTVSWCKEHSQEINQLVKDQMVVPNPAM